MSTDLLDPAAARLMELASRGEGGDLGGGLAAGVKPNLRTGEAAIDAAALRRSLMAVLPDAVAIETSGAIQSFFAPGFLVLPPLRRRGRGVPVPWGLVEAMLDSSRGDLARMVAADLGLEPAASATSLQQALDKQPRLPEFLRSPELLERFAENLRKRDDPENDTGWDGEGARPPRPGSAGFPPPPPALPDAWACIQTLGTWSVDGWGVSLCVNGPCAESIARLIDSAMLSGSFTSFASAMVSGGVAALTGSSMVGFCIAVGLTVVGGALKIWILTENQKTNGSGVCIRFHWPYVPFVGGLPQVSARTP